MFIISNNDLRNLQELNMNQNRIEEIFDKAFENVPNLITLNLNGNNIENPEGMKFLSKCYRSFGVDVYRNGL